MLLVDAVIEQYKKGIFDLQTRNISSPLATSGIKALAEAIRSSEKILFAPSTMRMLSDKKYDEVIDEVDGLIAGASRDQIVQELLHRASAFTSGWIEFYKPIKFPVEISAMFCYRPSHFLETGKDSYQLLLVDQFADVPYLMEARENMEWCFLPTFHQCRMCRRENKTIIPCDLCKSVLVTWSQIFALSMIIAGQYLAAMRYEEKIFSGIRRTPRQHNEKKVKKQHVSYQFKVIDANEIIIPVSHPEQSEHDVRGSWVEEAKGQGNLVYIETHTRPFQRTYRNERYAASGLMGTTVKFAEGITRQQPRRKDLVGKHVTKVKASDYEMEEKI